MVPPEQPRDLVNVAVRIAHQVAILINAAIHHELLAWVCVGKHLLQLVLQLGIAARSAV